MNILITGAAGFIGYHLSRRLAESGDDVVAIDNMNNYYDVKLKYDRLAQLGISSSAISENICVCSTVYPNLRFAKSDIMDQAFLIQSFEKEKFDCVCHLAGQAGVRYSLDHPDSYIQNNIVGFYHMLELCRQFHVSHLVFASSSSVYGNSTKIPFSENDRTDNPVSLYAATKKSNELMAYAYSHLYGIQVAGLRFFTVYGPWGRPDMSPMLFADALLRSRPINVFNHGKMMRDFTYVDDVVECIARVVQKSVSAYRIYNVGRSEPVTLMDFIHIMEEEFGVKARLNMLPMQAGDVLITSSDTSAIVRDYGYRPQISLREGIRRFACWYSQYEHVNVSL
jgi:UDP-glucuronate 4-epimerase